MDDLPVTNYNTKSERHILVLNYQNKRKVKQKRVSSNDKLI